ncbi:membrane protein insertase YidC [Amycolatopsis sp. YIM 10]|uniref:YidC/Oxa1 family membrane protein insertase n=1 Tax=Amycolatopsis sp. YIM 10 TaxID=2653857 RepID=UPI001290061D|nr:membrane protein insertase YidC [Amycolatopsis sp. YIM 10]QFU93756.1 Membrane protein insertase YidC [Amycolatopsis sp. YIM 10]
MFEFLDVPVSGALFLVGRFAGLIDPVTAPVSVALTIVLFTAAIRLLLLPFSRAAVRGEKARAKLMPELKKLQEKHKNDPEKLRAAAADLQRESGTSFFAGCLPSLAQIPFFMVMYRLFAFPTVNGQPNPLLDDTLFGTPLGAHFTSAAGPVFFGLFALLAVVAWFSSRWQAKLMAANSDTGNPVPGGALLRLLPFGTLLVAAFVPLAAGLYLLTTTTWTLVERAVLRREPGVRTPVAG